MLTLERARHPKQKQNADWQRRERASGSFSRAVQLPFRIDPDKVEGRSHNGILEIELQRLEGGPVEKDRDPPRLSLSEGVSNGPRSENCELSINRYQTVESDQPSAPSAMFLAPADIYETTTTLSCSQRRRVSLSMRWISHSSVGIDHPRAKSDHRSFRVSAGFNEYADGDY